MAKLQDRVQNALDETRILVLGLQVLLGQQFQWLLGDASDRLTALSRGLSLGALGLLLLGFVMLVAPTFEHRLVEKGTDSARLHRVTTRWSSAAMLPLAIAFAGDLFVAVDHVLGPLAGLVFSAVFVLFELTWFYALPWGLRLSHRGEGNALSSNETARTSLTDKIRHVLTEARVIIPGAQAMLGFQLVTTLNEGFGKLEPWMQRMHLVGIGLVAVTVVLLMAPAAYHRIVEHGDETERFHRFCGAMLMAALPCLVCAMAVELWLVVYKVTRSQAWSVGAASTLLLLAMALWFIGPLVRMMALRDRRT